MKKEVGFLFYFILYFFYFFFRSNFFLCIVFKHYANITLNQTFSVIIVFFYFLFFVLLLASLLYFKQNNKRNKSWNKFQQKKYGKIISISMNFESINHFNNCNSNNTIIYMRTNIIFVVLKCYENSRQQMCQISKW